MTKVGKKLIAAAKEVSAIAQGKAKPARTTTVRVLKPKKPDKSEWIVSIKLVIEGVPTKAAIKSFIETMVEDGCWHWNTDINLLRRRVRSVDRE